MVNGLVSNKSMAAEVAETSGVIFTQKPIWGNTILKLQFKIFSLMHFTPGKKKKEETWKPESLKLFLKTSETGW